MLRDVERCWDFRVVVDRCCSGSCSAQWLGASLRCPWTPGRQGEFKQVCPSKLETLNTFTEYHILWICVDWCWRKHIFFQCDSIPHSLIALDFGRDAWKSEWGPLHLCTLFHIFAFPLETDILRYSQIFSFKSSCFSQISGDRACCRG